MCVHYTRPFAQRARVGPDLGPPRRKKRYAPRLIWIADCHADLLGTILSRSQQQQSGCVYLLFDSASCAYKLGCTRRPHARFLRLQTLTPHTLQVTHVIETGDIKAVERFFHLHFVAERARGEWFGLTDADVALFYSHETLYTVREVA